MLINFLQPLEAHADTVLAEADGDDAVSLDHLEDVPVNTTITNKSSAYIFETTGQKVRSNKIKDTRWPGYGHYLHLYNATDGKLQDSKKAGVIARSNVLRITTLPEYGVNKYITLLLPSINAPDHIHDVNNAMGKSEILEWERKHPIELSLQSNKTEKNESFNIDFSFNQNVGDMTDFTPSSSRYSIYLYEIRQNFNSMPRYAGKTSERLDKSGNIGSFNYDRNGYEKKYIALFASRVSLSAVTSYNYIAARSIATSNIITVKKEPWGVSVDSSDEYETLDVEVSAGDGDYSTYLVEDTTGDILWHDNKDTQGVSGIDNRGHDNTQWATAYVAENYKKDTTEKPSTFEEIHGIIADSKTVPAPHSGVRQDEDVAGGHNPSETCNIRCTGDPVNNATGEFFDTQEDIKGVGTGLLPHVERTFSTVHKDVENSLGKGWRTNYDMKIDTDNIEENSHIAEHREVKIENENGSLTTFYRSSDGTYQAAKSNTLATLQFNEDDQQFIYKRLQSRDQFIFDNSGKLVEINNDKNRSIALTYQNEQLVKVSDTVGNELSFVYNTQNFLSSVESSNGEAVSYSYTTDGKLQSVNNSKNIDFSYTYDSDGRMSEFTNAVGGVFKNFYDDKDRVTRQTDPLGRHTDFAYTGDITNGTTELTYPNGKVNQETYKNGQLVKLVENHHTENSLTWRYQYDENGNTVSIIQPDESNQSFNFNDRLDMVSSYDEHGHVTEFAYDNNHNILRMTNALGHETVYTYDEQNNLTSSTIPLGEKTTFEYDTYGNMISTTDARGNVADIDAENYTTHFNYTEHGLLSSTTDPHNNTTTASYDNFGQEIALQDPMQNTVEASYDTRGFPAVITDQLENETMLTHDTMGNVLTSKDAEGNITSYTYDAVGNMLSMTNALDETTQYSYDSMDNIEKVVYADGASETIAYDVFNRAVEMIDTEGMTTKQEFDVMGNMIKATDAEGNTTEYKYNKTGQLLEIKDDTESTVKYVYNDIDQVVSMTDALNRITQYVYDGNGRVIEEIQPDNSSIKTTYDSVGNIHKVVDEDGHEKTYEHDALNRQVSYTNENDETITYE